MREQHGERIPPRITISAQLHECGDSLLCVFVSDLRITSHDLLSLSLYMICELLNELLEIFHHTPVLILLIANRPNAR